MALKMCARHRGIARRDAAIRLLTPRFTAPTSTPWEYVLDDAMRAMVLVCLQRSRATALDRASDAFASCRVL